MNQRKLSKRTDFRRFAAIIAGILWMVFTHDALAASARVDPAGVEFFEKEVRPLLVKRCYSCHSSNTKQKGELALDSRDGWAHGGEHGPAISPGDASASLLIKAVRRLGPEMPPKEKLSDAEIAVLSKWVELGAPDPRVAGLSKPGIDLEEARRHWAFRPPQAAPAPAVMNADWPRGVVDQFLLAKMEAHHVAPVADAGRISLIRRLSFDLTGLPPTPQEVAAFLDDTSTNAIPMLVDRLLASSHFGERWGRHWLDVARFAESGNPGGARAIFGDAWRYRDYVIDAFNRDMPYDQFIVEQLAGDLLPSHSQSERDRHVVATGFLTLSPLTTSAPGRNEQFRMDLADEQIDVTTKAFMALTVACARCHDHKFDPIPTTEYYGLAGIFRSTELRQTMMCPKKRHIVAYYLGTPIQGHSLDEAQAYVDNLLEIQKLQDRVQELQEILGTTKSRKVKPKEPASAVALSKAAAIREVEQSAAQIARLRALPLSLPPMATAVRDEPKPANCQVRIRGEVEDLGPEAPRGMLSILTYGELPTIDPSTSGRLELARWIASADNPLTARVMVNRIWHHVFGPALVPSIDNFGTTGESPTHPELLDYLAVQFVRDGWSVKKMIRTLVLSRAYQIDTRRSESDPDNQWYTSAGRRQLDAETLRDSILAFSGQMDGSRPAGPMVRPLLIEEVTQAAVPIIQESNRRSVYIPWVRDHLPEVLRTFDVADSDTVIGEREQNIVAPQALFMLNSRFVIDQSRHAARRLLADKERSNASRIDLAYRLALGRPASPLEIQKAQNYIQAHREMIEREMPAEREPSTAAWASFCQILIASAEFRFLN